MLRSWLIAFLVLALPAPGQAEAADDRPALVVKIHADWCGTCRALEPTWSVLEGEDRARLVVLDVTDQRRLGEARARAKALGIESFFDAHKARTGTIAVIDARSQDVVAVYKGERDPAVYRGAIDELVSGDGA